MVAGAIIASAVGFTVPGAVVQTFADELIERFTATGVDPSKLVRIKDKDYIVDQEDWVSSVPLQTARVKKIEFGRVSYVTIATTSTGTYSTDALFSNHVQYPGISVQQVKPPAVTFAIWRNGSWSTVETANAASFVTINIHQR
ncbi:hypothetical protein WH87_00690 [Devosia epidermidihirudinis]|uniref:Uncharacterized protein n=1 Tax=Devosia epidermidihirudinis TaxID=1293439 RepID=A0A0F5QN59_9HYPH|nr:hypothetical protein [Devosia epidermidihirudinis]KKC41494.1 hypothetical protein WH87_00690 [Devosia epidermidihirudinis]